MAGTVLLSHDDVLRLLTPEACIAAVEDAFRQHALGKAPRWILGMHAPEGSFHLKAALLEAERTYFAAKLNANFPQNGARHGLPTIQGAVLLFDAANGAPLAIMDSMSITALRTAAATAVAAKHLAREQCRAALICGCGAQAPAQIRALLHVRKPGRIYAYDLDSAKAGALASLLEREVPIEPVSDLARGAAMSDLIITCTSARAAFLMHGMVQPGTFVAAVGADSEAKQEIDPRLMARSTVVTDITEQACAIGDLHHAIDAGALSRGDVHAELGEVVTGAKRGRSSADEIIVFDSTGTGLQDAAAAAAVYRNALDAGARHAFSFGGQP